MRLVSIIGATCLLAAGCGEVKGSRDGGLSDLRDGGGRVADASGPDATPVACDGPEDCMNPDDPCLLAGPCEDNVCHFAAMNCGELDGACTQGICQDGACEAKPIHEAEPCGAGVMACGAFDDCGGFADDCDESGTQARSCTDSTCAAGECVTSAPYADSRNCTRPSTDGVECADSTTSCGTCAYTSTCDRTAPAVSCTRTDHDCLNESCGSANVSLPNQSCDRDTECNDCTTIPGGMPGVCSAAGGCFVGNCN